MKTIIACFGDSLIYGFPFGREYGWLTKVNELAPEISLLNYGECGASCDDILSIMKATPMPQKVQKIIFMGGANDILQERPLKVILKDMEQAQKWAAEKKCDFGLVLPLLMVDSTLNYKIQQLRTQCYEEFAQRCQLFDFQPCIGTTKQELYLSYFDGIHPTAKTYNKIGVFAKNIIEAWLEEGRTL